LGIIIYSPIQEAPDHHQEAYNHVVYCAGHKAVLRCYLGGQYKPVNLHLRSVRFGANRARNTKQFVTVNMSCIAVEMSFAVMKS
jgi:hypothetical protein